MYIWFQQKARDINMIHSFTKGICTVCLLTYAPYNGDLACHSDKIRCIHEDMRRYKGENK